MRPDALRIPRISRRWIPVILLLVILIVLGWAVARGPLRHGVADALGVRLKNEILADWTLALSPTPQTADLAPLPFQNVPPYAVNVFLDQEVQTQNVDRELDLVKHAGFRYIKQELIWNDVERPAKGEYVDGAVPTRSSWAKYDRIVNLAQARGLGVIFRIDTSPAWARPGTTKIESPPENYADYGDFVAAVVQRYKGRVRFYQIWNEPNWEFEWGGRPATPEEYTALLRIAYQRAKAIDPSVVILSAPLAPTIENSPRATSDVSFLQGMYQAGARPYFDILSVNAYGLRNGPDDFRFNRTDDVNFARPVLLREIMVNNNDANKPVWASEIGWNSLPPNWPEQPIFGSVSRELQAEYTVRAYQRAAEQWPWMGLMAVWHFRKVSAAATRNQDYYFDLVTYDWKLEPIYNALKSYMTAPPVVYRGFHQEDLWSLTWGPGWKRVADAGASLGHLNQTDTSGATLSFNLDASWLDLVTPVGPNQGTLEVTIDGSPLRANRLPLVDGRALLNLASAAPGMQTRQPIADELGPGIHHVVIRVRNGSVAIDGLVADRESPRDRLYWHLGGTILGLTVLGWTIGRRPIPAVRDERESRSGAESLPPAGVG